jgi:diadenylate cyclase
MQYIMIPGFIHVRVIDIVDILLVAFLMYQIYMFIKGTIAIYIFVTIITFYVAWLLVKDNMLLLGSILGQIIGVGAIAIIVVFQQELRRFLILFSARYLPKAGISIDNFFSKIGTGLPVMNINSIIKACVNMSKDRVGALIVLQRNSMLDSYAGTGDILDARTTSRLIESIFNKRGPLHDGAAIIYQDRIRAACCILPVSENFEIPEHYGLRHRAAIGLSEQTDALVIIISEETGNISMAEGGILMPADIKTLHKKLEGEFLKKK